MILETTNPEFMTLLKSYVPKYNHLRVKLVDKDGKRFNRTLAYSAGGEHIMVLGYRRKRYGNYVSWDYYKSVIIPEKKATENDKWIHSWTNVLKRLEKSGLWEDVAKDVRVALAVGPEKLEKAYKQYWVRHDYKNLTEEDKSNAEIIKEIDERLVGYRDDGTIYADTSIIWYMHKPAKVKKMCFGRKWINDSHLENIAKALESKTEFSTFRTYGYDVTFSYRPEVNKAWYSEEYRHCGNGHYYLALDATHALFYEDD